MILYKYTLNYEGLTFEELEVKKETAKRYELKNYHLGEKIGAYFHKGDLEKCISCRYKGSYCILLEADEEKAKTILRQSLEEKQKDIITELENKIKREEKLLEIIQTF